MSEFEMLLEKNLGALERFVPYHISNIADSEDILQETVFAAFRQFDKLRNKEHFKAWIIGIARNKCSDYYRSICDSVCIDELTETELIQSRYGLLECSPVLDTIEALGKNDRQILQLCYYDDLPQKEIAEKLNIPLGTVKSRLNTARHNFKELYSCPPKGEKNMFKLPEKMPEYKIIPSDESPFAVK